MLLRTKHVETELYLSLLLRRIRKLSWNTARLAERMICVGGLHLRYAARCIPNRVSVVLSRLTPEITTKRNRQVESKIDQRGLYCCHNVKPNSFHFAVFTVLNVPSLGKCPGYGKSSAS